MMRPYGLFFFFWEGRLTETEREINGGFYTQLFRLHTYIIFLLSVKPTFIMLNK